MAFNATFFVNCIFFIGIIMDALPASIYGEMKHNRRKRTLSLYNWTWPKGIIPYTIDSSIYPKNADLIKKAMEKIANLTCVRWLPKSDTVAKTVGHESYVRFIDHKRCHSRMGYMGRSKQDLSLANDGCMYENTILHEMLHAMGFLHEQNRSDRDKYIIFDPSRLYNETFKNNFKKLNTDNSVPYDLQSVLQYNISDFGKSVKKGERVLELRDPNLEFLILSSNMSYYDVVRVLKAYKCSAQCNQSTVPSCKYGILNHKCECYCMHGFRGPRCDKLETDQDCGGSLELHSETEEKIIKTPNYPKNYPTGKVCKWVITTPKKYSPRVTIENLDLPSKQSNRSTWEKVSATMECYHWLEIQYNLPGQTGIWKCGDVPRESWTGSKDSEGTMILTFYSNVNKDQPAGKGFLLKVKAIKTDCGSSTCVNGHRIDGDKACEFKCICNEGYVGRLCDQIKREKKDCIRTPRGTDYMGTLSKTRSGKTCLPWKFGSLKDAENYCRNPNGRANAPFCLIPGISMEYCTVSHCDSEECRRSETGYEYDGVIHTTESGRECQRWDSMEPHKHNWDFLAAHENFCRNFGDKKNHPWCFTTDKNVEWEYCDIPKCDTEPKACSLTAFGVDYFGNISKTSSGLTCQGWDSPVPHFHWFANLRDQKNFCRNADANFHKKPWCYTTNPNKTSESCDIPICDEKDACFSSPCLNGGTCAATATSYKCQCDNGFSGQRCQVKATENQDDCLMTRTGWEYSGTKNKTIFGYTCLYWKETSMANELGDQENYCRNKDRSGQPWCYVKGQQVQVCDIPRCQTDTYPKECLKTPRGEKYFGTVNRDQNGYSCKRWDSSEDYTYMNDQENYCRNPDGDSSPWCLSTDPSNYRAYCNIPPC